jgi:RND superfamily putative drug exporter
MFVRLGRFTVRFRKLILVLTLVFMGVAGVVGSGVFGSLHNGGFEDPASESARAKAVLAANFGNPEPNAVVLVTAAGGSVDAPDVVAAGNALTARLGALDGVRSAASYWSLGSPPALHSERGDEALVLLRVSGEDDTLAANIDRLAAAVHETGGTITATLGGPEPAFRAIGKTVESDLGRAEAIAVPITLVLLIAVFGSLVAASLPLAVGSVAVLGTFLSLWIVAQITDVSIFSINLTTALGLGLAIDYSLFIVTRFREEMAKGLSPDAAVVRTVDTAGRTVAFSALTVAASLGALLVFHLYFLRSFAYAGIAVVLIAAITSVFSLPALLAVLGPKVNAGRVFGRRRAAGATVGDHGFWHRLATTVMRRPLVFALAVIAILIGLGLPFRNVAFGTPDDRVLSPGSSARAVGDKLRDDFTSRESNGFPVVLTNAGSPTDRDANLDAYASALSKVSGVARVDTSTGHYAGGSLVAPPDSSTQRFSSTAGAWLNVIPGVEPVSPQGEALVKALRAVPAPEPALVGGQAAQLVDSKASIASRLPLAGAIIAVITFVLLFLMFGSLLVPAKAIVLNLLSLSATFGAMVWIFQEGHGRGLLDFTATGTLDVTTPILMFCIAFGLSMDYEVFLLSRIKEEHDRTGDNVHSVATGLEKTGRLVTAAAVLLSVTFLAFGTSGVTFIKVFGLGLALAVVMDATLVRGVLVPAFMRLAGSANWWAPGPLRRLHARIGFSEHSGDYDDVDDDVDVDEPGMPQPERPSVAPRQLERIERGRSAVASLQRAGLPPELFR